MYTCYWFFVDLRNVEIVLRNLEITKSMPISKLRTLFRDCAELLRNLEIVHWHS